ncbi:hypothetical protein TKK_0010571 [Trichogramma kaykai]|uniref:RUN domain-containing protein n=1 Tax=Trichogramma kaykai TaxID=54128 RepID=A0ABD2WV35_9HYME
MSTTQRGEAAVNVNDNDEARTREKYQLLQNLRSVVEGLLTNGLPNVWNVYGGLNRLHAIMEKIFKHGCRTVINGEPDCWTFIQGLNWLQPSLASSPSIGGCDEYHANLPSRIISRKDTLWLYKSLENHSLSQKLSWLLSDKEHLLSCLEPWAYLCDESLAEATLICLQAVEKNQFTLLTDINPALFLKGWFPKHSPKHRRSSSYPVNLCYGNEATQNSSSQLPLDLTTEAESAKNKIKEDTGTKKNWNSLIELTESNIPCSDLIAKSESAVDGVSKDTQSIELSDVIQVDYSDVRSEASTTVENKCSSSKSKSASRKLRKHRANKLSGQVSNGSTETISSQRVSASSSVNSNFNAIDFPYAAGPHKPGRRRSFFTGSAPEFSSSWSSEVEGQKDPRTPRKSFIEDGGSSVLPMSTAYFPKPEEGQSLTSFLTSACFTKTNAELDRENAHFSISEAMIAAIEQLKCNRRMRLAADEAVDESDEEIKHLQQRIRMRRRQREAERRPPHATNWSRDLLSDGKTDTTTTDQSVSPLSTSSGTLSDSISTDDVDDYVMDEASNLLQIKNSGLSVSMASMYSEADIYKSSQSKAANESSSNTIDSMTSAEGVALSLISRFSEKHLPRASELKWLVSEQDAPQRLLPLPKSWPISPDDAEGDSMPLRGTAEWAPPRAQIIFTPHPPPVRKILIAKQNYRCAGCGMKVAVEYASKFRYCEYLGRYFCTGCHTNQVTFIPGKILTKWDFSRYPVSNFAYRLLDRMMDDPLFPVTKDLYSSLYRRSKQLHRTRLLRTQLFYFKDFLFNCRFATKNQEALKRVPSHWLLETQIYSITDFTLVKSGALPTELDELVQSCWKHVEQCILCQARGFVCELCNSKEVIYPWNLNRVVRCNTCGSCYHSDCVRGPIDQLDCKKCNRLRERRKSQDELVSKSRL